jgi:hypothetical protein
MKPIHVCLVSDQTIPNILGIMHFKPEHILFITTEEMKRKNKTEAILNTIKRAGIDPTFSEIVVKEDSPYDCQIKISQWIESTENDQFTVNLTCGTKIMSISVFHIFRDYGSMMIYIPYPKNEFIQIYPIKKNVHPESISLRLGVVDYLTAYSLKVINEKKLEQKKEEAEKRKNLTKLIIENYKELEALLKDLYSKLALYRTEKFYNFEFEYEFASDSIYQEFFRQLGCELKEDKISKKLTRREIQFLTGGWLEEYVFNCVNSLLDKEINDAVLGIEIENIAGSKNEFDVMFTKDNAIYFIECKSLSPDKNLAQESLYKIGALQKEFGLRVRSFFVTTSQKIMDENGQIRQSIKARAEQFNTEIITYENISNLEEILKQKLKIS